MAPRTYEYMRRHESARTRARLVLGRKPRPNWKTATIMTTSATAKGLARQQAFHAAMPASGMAETNSLRRCERALDMLLTQRGDAFAEVERMLADHPESVFGHCLRAALIVRRQRRYAIGACGEHRRDRIGMPRRSRSGAPSCNRRARLV